MKDRKFFMDRSCNWTISTRCGAWFEKTKMPENIVAEEICERDQQQFNMCDNTNTPNFFNAYEQQMQIEESKFDYDVIDI